MVWRDDVVGKWRDGVVGKWGDGAEVTAYLFLKCRIH